MKKFKLFVDVNKEEKWLNDMVAKGYDCIYVSQYGMYTFIENNSKKQIIRIDSQKFKTKEQHQQYIQLYEDYGWQHISGSRGTAFQYWKKQAGADDSLFSDRDSQKAYYRRLLDYYGGLTFLFIMFGFMMLKGNLSPFSIKNAYFTPNLWDKTGIDFTTAFLFETPFALLRFGIPWVMWIPAIAFTFTYYKYQQQVKKMEK